MSPITNTFALLVFLLWLTPSWAADCGCRFQKAHSESSVGTCAVREDMARDCDLVWGMPPGPASKEARASYFDDNSIFAEITQAAAQAAPSPDAESLAPGVSHMSDPAFWTQFQSEIRRRTSIDDRVKPGTLDLSLAFLANSDATSDFRQFTVGALTYVTVVNLRQGTIAPAVRKQMLLTMMRYRGRLAAFASSGGDQGSFEQAGKLETNGAAIDFLIRARTIRGCFDLWIEELTVSSFIKAPWSPTKGRRCD